VPFTDPTLAQASVSPISHGGICGEQSGTRTEHWSRVSAFPCHYHSTIASHSSAHL